MRFTSKATATAAAAAAVVACMSDNVAAGSFERLGTVFTPRSAASITQHGSSFSVRDASTVMSKGENNEGEAHGKIDAPSGSTFTSLPIGSGGASVAAYWTSSPKNSSAEQAFIMIHGKLRDGDTYWETMDNVLNKAVDNNVAGAHKDSIVVAPQFFSTKYNSGQYDSHMLAFGDVNAWQAGDPATHPSDTKLTSFDALDALVDEFQSTSKYPSMKNITVVGHGGGGQLIQRYAAVAKNPSGNVHVRYIHGDPSSCAYFTKNRPTSMDGSSVPHKKHCPEYNEWRYGFDNFTGTADGLKTPQEYFKQYITRDVVSIVGYEDTKSSGDQYCMAKMQGGSKRRDRNLAWWQYVNTLARTPEDLNGFPATFGKLPDWSSISENTIATRLVVVENADHDAEKVFESSDGQAVLFAGGDLPTGWRPKGWKPVVNAKMNSSASPSATSSSNRNYNAQSGTATPQQDNTSAAALTGKPALSLVLAGAASLVAILAGSVILS